MQKITCNKSIQKNLFLLIAFREGSQVATRQRLENSLHSFGIFSLFKTEK